MIPLNAIEKSTNRLKNEKSPYLLQHAHNPVDWYPWGAEAFEKAQMEDKPIFLSIGYSSCHWCHVMERETFSAPETAEHINRVCVSIKVDREERPDVDAVYMDACVALTGSGGWPLSVFITPDKRPFFAGTYYPAETFVGLLERIERLWREDRQRLLDASNGLTEALQARREGGSSSPVTAEEAETLARQAFTSLAKGYDAQYGGFGPAPKFPSAHTLMFLERYGQLHPRTHARAMARYTLERMALGGLQDHVGGGFFRYSTDRFYRIPHFEKMLYDNAQMATVYAEAGMERTARRTLEFCLRELRSPEGAFYAALDADSDGGEGAYYLISRDDIREMGEDAERYAELYDITDAGNYEGLNQLNLLKYGPLPEAERILADRCNEQLLAARARRVPPMRDEKILLGWNGLMLGALATCGRLWHDRALTEAALSLAVFLRDHMRRDGRWYGVWYAGHLGSPKATSDDYAYFAWGLYRLHQATLDVTWLNLCAEVCAELPVLFGDDGGDGLLYLAGRDVTDLPFRTKNTQDAALPSGNAIAAGVLRRLGLLTGEERWYAASERLTSALLAEARSYPAAYPAAISAALLTAHGRKVEVPRSGALREAADEFHPFAAIRASEGQESVHGARVCTSNACLPPVEDADTLLQMITPPFGK